MNQQLGEKQPLLTRIVDMFLRGDVAILLTIVSILMGVAALMLTAREEEPQIVVPMADVFISAPGMSAEEVERKITTRLEKLLYQIDGVEYVYSMSRPGSSVVTVRFFVGEDRERSLIRLYNKIHSHQDDIPPGVEALGSQAGRGRRRGDRQSNALVRAARAIRRPCPAPAGRAVGKTSCRRYPTRTASG